MRAFPALLVLVGSQAAQAIAIEPVPWRLIASSDVILVGTVEGEKPVLSDGPPGYRRLFVRSEKALKGTAAPNTILTIYYSPDEIDAKDIHSLVRHRKRFILFVVSRERPPYLGMYLAPQSGGRSWMPMRRETVDAIEQELQAEQAIIDQQKWAEDYRETSSYRVVCKLVAQLTDDSAQDDAVAALERLGRDAVPALVLSLDDRRPVGHRRLVLTGGAGGERVRTYHPEVVADVAAALLNHITGELFGFTYNGGSENERLGTSNAWKIYLYKTMFGAGNRN